MASEKKSRALFPSGIFQLCSNYYKDIMISTNNTAYHSMVKQLVLTPRATECNLFRSSILGFLKREVKDFMITGDSTAY